MNSEIIKDSKILIIDDKPSNLSVIFENLDRRGGSVLLAQNGQKGLKLAETEKPDIILLDIVMPDMNGYEVIRTLKENKETEHIPVIFMTALADTENILKGFESGSIDYIIKPVEQKELIARISTHLKLKRAEEKLHYRLKTEELAKKISRRFINFKHGDFDREVENSLKDIGEFLNIDRCDINIMSIDFTIKKIYEWSSCKIEQEYRAFIKFPMENWFINILKNSEIIDFSAGSLCESEEVKKFLREQNIKSALIMPMTLKNSLFGFLAFESIKKEKTWEDRDLYLIQIMGDIFINGLDRKNMEIRIRDAQKLESLGVMSAGIAHKFNNILGTILGFAELTLDMTEDEQVKENLNYIITSTGRAADISKQILHYTGHNMCMKEKIDLSIIAREACKIKERGYPENCSVTYELSEDEVPIKGNYSRIIEMVEHLLINASEAIEGEKGTVLIRTKVKDLDSSYLSEAICDGNLTEGLYACLEVEDNGCGMKEDIKNKIFDPFFTTKFLGRGLGLSSVMGTVKLHKGGINVKSEPGKGTVITVFFPVFYE